LVTAILPRQPRSGQDLRAAFHRFQVISIYDPVSINCSLDGDAHDLLRAMAPHSKGIGRLLSELLRKEARERAARSQWLETLRHQAEAGLREEVARAID